MPLQNETTEIKERALALVQAQKAYIELLNASTSGLDDEALAEREIAMTRARRALGDASYALSKVA